MQKAHILFHFLLFLIFFVVFSTPTVDADQISKNNQSYSTSTSNSTKNTEFLDIQGKNKIIIPLQSDISVPNGSSAIFTNFSTVRFGDAGYIRLTASGGRFYIHIGLTDWDHFPVYTFHGKLRAHFTNGKTKTWSLKFTHVSRTDWSSYRTYSTYGKHGTVSLTGTAYSLAQAHVISNSMGF